MDILVITNLFPNNDEPGRGIFISQQLEELAKLSNTHIICPIAWYPFKKCPRTHNADYHGLKVSYIRYFYTPKILRCFYGVFLFLSIFLYLLKSRQAFDVIYTLWVYPDGYAGWLISKLYKKPHIVYARGSDINILTKKTDIKYLIRQCLKGSDLVLAVSRDLMNKIVNLGIAKEKVIPIHNGVNKKRFFLASQEDSVSKLNIDSSKKLFLFIGALRNVKRVLNLISVMKEIVTSGRKDIELAIIGKGYLEEKIKAEIQKYNLQPYVKLIGAVPHDIIPVWMNASYSLVLPSFSEGCPNVALEALSCGLPVIATNVGGIPEIVSNGNLGILVEPDDLGGLKDAFIKSASINWDREMINQNMEHYDWGSVAYKVHNLLYNLVKK